VVAADLSSPEATLAGYIDSLRKGSVSGVLERFHGITEFKLPRSVPIQEYKIVKKVIFGPSEVENWNGHGIVPPAQLGDIELHVSEIVDGNEVLFSYNFRNFSGSWKIYSHSAWDED
jgi:hypothetical protein